MSDYQPEDGTERRPTREEHPSTPEPGGSPAEAAEPGSPWAGMTELVGPRDTTEPAGSPTEAAESRSPWADTSEPGSPWADTTEPGNPQPNAAEPGNPRPDAAESGNPQPDTTEPGSPQPDTAESGGPWADTTEPGSPQPDTTEPGNPWAHTTEPGSSQPDTAELGNPWAHTAEPGNPQPHTAQPTTFQPHTTDPQPRTTEASEPPEWIDPTPTGPVLVLPPPPAPVPLEPRSTAAAVLLNLTGIGLGYGYLRRWARAWVSTVLAAALVVVAFRTDAASNPWLWRGIAASWLAVLALDARRIGARHPRPEVRPTRPVLAGVLGVVLVAGGYVGYGFAGRDAYADGLAAQAGGDCATAVDEFDAVTGRYELTLSADVAAATRGRTECAAYTAATEAQRSGDHEAAVERYLRFRRDHPTSVLAPFVHDNLVETYATWARRLRDDGKLIAAIDVYRDLMAEDKSFRPEVADTYLKLAATLTSTFASADPPTRSRETVQALLTVAKEFADTPAAKQVPAAFDALYAVAAAPYANGQFCAALPVLEYFAGLTGPAVEKVAGEARNHFPHGMLECGLGQLRDGNNVAAAPTLERFVKTFPAHGDLPRAQSALINAKVGLTAGARLPVPAPLGTQGSTTVSFYNGVNKPVTVRVAGSTAHEFTLPPCDGCPPSFPLGGDAACPTLAGLPGASVRLDPGDYQVVPDYLSTDTVAKPLTVTGGRQAQYCVFVERAF